MNEVQLWKLIRKQKIEYVIDNLQALPYKGCFLYDTSALLDDDEDFRKMENQLGINRSSLIYNNNMRNETIDNANTMFFYFNLCPKGSMLDWIHFYYNVFQNASPDIILLTLNRIMVAAKRNGDTMFFKVAKQIFLTIATKFSLQYPNIDANGNLNKALKSFPSNIGQKHNQIEIKSIV